MKNMDWHACVRDQFPLWARAYVRMHIRRITPKTAAQDVLAMARAFVPPGVPTEDELRTLVAEYIIAVRETRASYRLEDDVPMATTDVQLPVRFMQ